MPKSFADKRDTFFKKRNLKRHPSIEKTKKAPRFKKFYRCYCSQTIILYEKFHRSNFKCS
ncbi:MAG: hypothetical protein C6W54_05340 [Bacillaceae bacterium]|jgi:hypothetical protein|nr:MAG: hypothetical protein C6W54_05340 [Bacillaceae bacterium]TVZ86924.1 hypothetical protein FB379_104150 [Aeribacillus composti]